MGTFALLAVMAVAGLAAVLGLKTSRNRLRELTSSDWRRVAGAIGVTLLWAYVAAGLAITLFGFPGPGLALLGLAVVGLLAIHWSREFRFLMSLEDGAFPGRFDKLIWALLMIALPPIGVLVFGSYRRAHWPVAEKPTVGMVRDLI